MFGMMNAMRIEVRLGAAHASVSAATSRRCYMRKSACRPASRLSSTPSAKRMLLQQKAYAEGGFALCMHAAALHDLAAAGDADAAALLDVQTEIVKSWPSEWCLEANKLAIQVLGGAGYGTTTLSSSSTATIGSI